MDDCLRDARANVPSGNGKPSRIYSASGACHAMGEDGDFFQDRHVRPRERMIQGGTRGRNQPWPVISGAIDAWFRSPTSATPPTTLPSNVGAQKRSR